MTPVQANTNGRLHPATEPSLSPLNRGFLYGDAIYEVWRTYAGVVFAWDEHWRRLESSARALHLTLPWTAAGILGEIRRTVAAHRTSTGYGGDHYIRLQIARGAGPIGLDVALADQPEFVLLVQPCPALTAEQASAGLRLSIARSIRRNPAESLDPAWKTGNYLNNLLGLREARARGADEVLFLNLGGEITEAAVSNVAFVKSGRLVLPPRTSGILPGITRGLVAGKVAAEAGIAVDERPVRPEDLGSFAECLLLSTTKDIVPVAAIDELSYPVRAESVTSRLKAAFAAYAGRYAAEHPDQKV